MPNARRYRRKPSKPRRKANRKIRNRGGKFGNPKSMSPSSSNYAKIVETTEYEDLGSNTMYSGLVTLRSYPRALAVAANFQWYRITQVKYIYQPQYNTFQEGTPTAIQDTIPQFIMIMNRNGAFQALTSDDLEQQGAKPTKFTGNRIVQYKPNTVVLSAIGGTDGTAVAPNVECQWNKWLSTQGSNEGQDSFDVPYYGHQFYFDQAIVSGGFQVSRLAISVVVEFKNPAQPARTPTQQSVTVKVKTPTPASVPSAGT